MIVYDNLWETMKARKVSQYALIKKHNVSPAQITRLKKNRGVSVNTINRLCSILKCDITDVMRYEPEEWQDNTRYK